MKINASDYNMVVHHPTTGEVLGEIITREYQNEGVQRHSFSNGTKEFRLGVSTNHFEFTDWPDIFQPILDQGFEVSKLILARGGLKVHAVLQNPSHKYRDPLNWDSASWGKSEGLTESIIITAGMKTGYGYHFRRGFFRMICENGLVVPSLQLGSGDFSHRTFSADSLYHSLFGREVVVTGDEVMGEAIGKPKAIKKLISTMNRFDGPEKTQEAPQFMRNMISPLTHVTGEVREELINQFEQLCQIKREVFELDISNAMTSALNKPEKVAQRNFFIQEKLQKSLVDLTGVFSL